MDKMINNKKFKDSVDIIIGGAQKADISKNFGLIKKRKMSGQEFKYMVRKGWKR